MGKTILFSIIIFIIATIIVVIIFSRKKDRINKYIKNITIESINSLSGFEFEEFLYYLFLSLGFDVFKTKSSHDYGADLILRVNNVRIAVQCKLYHNHSVGTSSVQEVYSATKYYNTNTGIVITNSHFSKNARNLANSTNILLWDRDTLNSILNLSEIERKNFKNKLMYQIISLN